MLYERRYILDARVDNGGYGTIDPTEIAGFQSSERSQGYWTFLHVGAARSMAKVFDDEVDHGDNAQRGSARDGACQCNHHARRGVFLVPGIVKAIKMHINQ